MTYLPPERSALPRQYAEQKSARSKGGAGAETLALRHALPPPRASKLSFWMGKNILHLTYCVPKLHFHHAATYEG